MEGCTLKVQSWQYLYVALPGGETNTVAPTIHPGWGLTASARSPTLLVPPYIHTHTVRAVRRQKTATI
eukprot:5936754-Pyramimonas_sp.AAC.1